MKAAKFASATFLSGIVAMVAALVSSLLITGRNRLAMSLVLVGFVLIVVGMVSALILETKALSRQSQKTSRGPKGSMMFDLAEILLSVLGSF